MRPGAEPEVASLMIRLIAEAEGSQTQGQAGLHSNIVSKQNKRKAKTVDALEHMDCAK
jgi:hypothetical protein